MSRGFASARLVTVLLAASVLSGSAQPPSQRPTFSVKVDLVRVDVSVTRRNRAVGGLGADDFVLYDNGVKQRLQPLSVEETPLEAWLVLDTSGSVRPQLSRLIQAALFFVNGLRSRDRAALVTFSEDVLVRQRPTTDLAQVRKTLASLQTSGITALYDATYTALRLREAGAARGVAVVLTDGYDNVSWLTADRVVASAERSDLVIYGVTVGETVTVVRGLGEAWNAGGSETPQYRFLRRLAELSGGRVFDATWSQLGDTFARIMTEIRARYVLSYYPTSTAAGWHAVEVRLARGRGDVRARRGYWVEARQRVER